MIIDEENLDKLSTRAYHVQQNPYSKTLGKKVEVSVTLEKFKIVLKIISAFQ